MAKVRVFNPNIGPVTFGNGQTIGGQSFQYCEQADVQALINHGVLLLKEKPSAPAPIEEPAPVIAPVAEPPSIDDSSLEVSAVSSDVAEPELEPTEEGTSGADEDESPVDEPSSVPTPATISKNRRRKSPSAKE